MASASQLSDLTFDELALNTRKQVTRRIMPFLFLLYFVAYLDRVNVSFAGLQMTKDLAFSPAVFGFGAGIFFIGYFLLEIPGALIFERFSARLWFARILICWGLLASALSLIHTPWQFYSLRFCLGVAEAGFFPGVLVYLSRWYCREDRAKMVALFMTAIPLSEILGAPLSGFLLQIHWLGYAGWRWMFVLEGIPAVVLGIVTVWYLPDRPSEVAWLSEKQKVHLSQQVMQNAPGENEQFCLRDAVRHPTVVYMALAYFCLLSANYGFAFWLPKIIQAQFAQTILQVSWLAALPYLIEIPVVMLIAWHSDRSGERSRHAAFPVILGAIAFAVSAWSNHYLWLTMLLLCTAASGMHSYRGPFWALMNSFPRRTAAAGIGMVSSFGNLGGFVGPYIVGLLATYTGAHLAGVLYLVICALLASFFIVYSSRKRRVLSSEWKQAL